MKKMFYFILPLLISSCKNDAVGSRFLDKPEQQQKYNELKRALEQEKMFLKNNNSNELSKLSKSNIERYETKMEVIRRNF